MEVQEFAFELPDLGFEAVPELGRHFRGRMNLMLDPACELRAFADALAVGRA